MRIVMLWVLLVLLTGLSTAGAWVVTPLVSLVVLARRCADRAEVAHLLAVMERKVERMGRRNR